jgi:uncharacterized protein
MRLIKKTGLLLLNQYIAMVERFRLGIIIFFIALTVSAVIYTVNNLGMNTNTNDMLSPELSWRKLDLEYGKLFPQYMDNILVVIGANTPDQAADAANLLYAELLGVESLFKSVYYPGSLSLFRQNALLFLSEQDLYDLADNLAKIQPFLTRLTDDMSLRGLFTMLSDAIDALEEGEDINIEPVLTQLTRAIQSTLKGIPVRVSWQNLIDNQADAGTGQNFEFIILQPILDYENLLPATDAIDKIRETSNLQAITETGATIRLSGDTVLAHEELLSVSRGTGNALILSICMVTIIMLVGLGSVRLVAFTLITLVTGLLLTAAFATIAIGELNLISIAFAVLYIGLGIDFAIHYCLRYRELLAQGTDNAFAIEESSRNLGQSLFICTLTTAIGFFAFIPTDYQGVAELGLISGAGMFISLFVTMTLLPALLRTLPLVLNGKTRKLNTGAVYWLASMPLRHSGKIKIFAAIILLSCIWLATNIRFDPNILNLQDPDNESVQTFTSLLESSDTSPWTGVIVADGREDAIQTKMTIEQLPVVEKVVWLDDFIPEDQDQKLAIIDELNLLLPGGFSDTGLSTNLSANDKYQVLQNFLNERAPAASVNQNSYVGDFIENLQAYVTMLTDMDEQQRATALDNFTTTMLASLPGRLNLLNDSLNADYISLNSLPDSLKQRWLSTDQHYLLSVYPIENLNNNEAMRRFVEETSRADPRIIGPPVINIEAGDAVIYAFVEALSYAVLAIALILLILLRNRLDMVLILSTLMFAVIVTGGLSVLMKIPLNFANIIALPLLLGMGVDSGIHILHRFRTALPGHNNILVTSSARAVIVSAFTTMCSIGTLAFSPHAGTASMGELLTIGIGMTLVATLLVLPGLLKIHPARGTPD